MLEIIYSKTLTLMKINKEKKHKHKLNKEDSTKIIGLIKDLLGERVSDVIESQRLVDSPCTLVSPKDGMNSHMERMMRSMNADFEGSKKIFEVINNKKLA